MEPEVIKAIDGGVYVQDDDKQGFTYQEPLPFTPDESDFSEKEWYTFTLQMDKSDWAALQEFFEERHIDYRNF